MSKNQPDAIELRSFLEFLQGFKDSVHQSISYLFGLIRKHLLWVLIPIVLLGGYGLFRYSQLEPLFQVEMQLGYNELHKRTYGEMILRLSEQLDKGNLAFVANVLNMSEDEVGEIASIEAQNIARSPLHEDVGSEKHPFYILAALYDSRISKNLEAGIIHYLKSNPLNLERRRINLVNLQDRLKFLEGQMAWMDSIKVNYNKQLKQGARSEQLANEMSIDRLFALSDTFYREWLGVRSGLNSYEAVELILGFTPQEKAEKPAAFRFLLKYVLAGLVISLLILLWMAIPSNKHQ